MKRTRGIPQIALLIVTIFTLGCVEQTPSKADASEPPNKVSVDKPVRPPADPALDGSTDKPADKPTVKLADKPTDKPADRPAVKPADKPADRPAVKPADKPAENLADKPADRPADKPADEVRKVIEKAVDKAVDSGSGKTGPVKVDIVPQYKLVKAGEETTLNLLVRLTADKVESATRSPMDLAIVIDRSGSMRGDKVRQVKQAAMDLISKLNRTDRVTLVTYSSDVMVHDKRLPMDEPGREKLRNKIAILWAGGSTALGPALFDGLEILEKAEREETDIAHVLMFSDGIANVGESRPEVLASRTGKAFANGISVTTLGVGLDYNEDLMTRIADQGGGRYHFIKDAEAIAGVLNDEFGGLSSTVARSMVLTFKGKDGIKLDRVYGYPTWEEDDETRIKVGTLYSGQTREILLRLKVTPAGMEKLALGDLGVKFADLTQGGEKLREEFKLAVDVTDDGGKVKESENTEVTIRVAEVESAEAMDKAARAVDRGDWHAARTIIDNNIGSLRKQAAATPSAVLDDQLGEMEASAGGLGAAKTSAEERKVFIKRSKAKSYDTMK